MLSKLFDWFEKLLDPYPDDELKPPPSKLLAFCLHYTKGSWGALIIYTVFVAIAALAEVWLYGMMSDLVDWLSTQDRATFMAEYGAFLVGVALLVALGLPLLIFSSQLIFFQTLMGNLPMRIRWLAHRQILGQSFEFYQDEFAGRVATKVMQAALSVRAVVTTLLSVIVYVAVYFLGLLFLVFTFHWTLFFLFLAWLASYLTLLGIFLPKLEKVGRAQADARSVMTGRVVDSYSNIITVKLFANAKREDAYARESMNGFLTTVYAQMRRVNELSSLLRLLNHLLIVLVAALSIYLWLHDQVTAGMLAAGIGLALRLDGMSQWVLWEVGTLAENVGMVHDSMSMLSKRHSVTDKPNAPNLVVQKAGIEFDQVTFNYGKKQGEAAAVLEELSLSVKPGERIGLVGRSGAGKSTLVNSLLRFYDIESGAIRIDGQSVADVTQESLRGAIGVVTQDTSLLHRSVRENIVYGRPDADDEDLIAAAKKAEAHEFIMELEDPQGRKGYDVHVGERGVKLSGGQRQRIAIARAMLKDAPILVLDEATSALDSEVEAAIQQSLFGLMEGKTVIAIAHRLSTIAAMDRLVVLDNGKIVEQGTHDELVRAEGLYASLWGHQSGSFLIEPALLKPDNE